MWQSGRLAFSGICLLSLCLGAGAARYGAAVAANPADTARGGWPIVEREHKGDRLMRSGAMQSSAYNASDTMPVAAVEVSGRFDSAVTVRDQAGRVVFRADPRTQTTILTERNVVGSAPSPRSKAAPLPGIPEGCEGSFSPHAAPGMAHVIRRCISGGGASLRFAAATP